MFFIGMASQRIVRLRPPFSNSPAPSPLVFSVRFYFPVSALGRPSVEEEEDRICAPVARPRRVRAFSPPPPSQLCAAARPSVVAFHLDGGNSSPSHS